MLRNPSLQLLYTNRGGPGWSSELQAFPLSVYALHTALSFMRGRGSASTQQGFQLSLGNSGMEAEVTFDRGQGAGQVKPIPS